MTKNTAKKSAKKMNDTNNRSVAVNTPFGIYEATQGEYIGATVYLVNVTQTDEEDFVFLTILNPELGVCYEISFEEWSLMQHEDSLKLIGEIEDDIMTKYQNGEFELINAFD